MTYARITLLVSLFAAGCSATSSNETDAGAPSHCRPAPANTHPAGVCPGTDGGVPNPIGQACTDTCAECTVAGGAIGPCICNGATWSCASDVSGMCASDGSQTVAFWYGGLPPATCSASGADAGGD